MTAPLERQFGQMPGLAQMSSTSSGGASVITLRFSLDVTLDVAEQQVQAAINAGSNLLPTDLPMPPTYSKVNPADAPVLTLAITSPSLQVIRIHDLVENRRLGAIYTRTDPPGMLFGLAMLPDGRLALALGSMLRLITTDGAVEGDIELPAGRGWANIVVRPGGNSLFVLDFFAGRVVELTLPGFRLLRLVDLGNPQGMTSLVEVP